MKFIRALSLWIQTPPRPGSSPTRAPRLDSPCLVETAPESLPPPRTMVIV
jgi:hypothetical protein